eukprot:768759-Hanusia_phi.AAC.10
MQAVVGTGRGGGGGRGVSERDRQLAGHHISSRSLRSPASPPCQSGAPQLRRHDHSHLPGRSERDSRLHRDENALREGRGAGDGRLALHCQALRAPLLPEPHLQAATPRCTTCPSLPLVSQSPVHDGTEKASWDVEKGEMSVSIAKLTPGEHFENLSSLTELLKKPTKKAGKELIQEVGGQAAGDGEEEDVDEVFEWEVDQNLPEEEPEDILRRSKYGFNDRHQASDWESKEIEMELLMM